MKRARLLVLARRGSAVAVFFTACFVPSWGHALEAKAPLLVANPEYSAVTGACVPLRKAPVGTLGGPRGSGQREVILFKQWHLAPGVDTHKPETPQLPQARNLENLYRQIEEWAIRSLGQNTKLTLIVEGCEGWIGEDFREAFNGWTLRDFRRELGFQQSTLEGSSSTGRVSLIKTAGGQSNSEFEAPAPGKYAAIPSHIALKLKAKFGERIDIHCGDSKAAIREHLLVFSDARAGIGFLARLQEHEKNPAKLALYLDGVIDAYHLPKGTTLADARAHIKKRLKGVVVKLKESLHARNRLVLEKLESLMSVESSRSSSVQSNFASGPIVIVYGGLHAPGIRQSISEKGWTCNLLEPHGYQAGESELFEALLTSVEKL